MTPQQLRNSILQLAIEGKLVEQRPEEGTGEELYQLIQEEKQELIKTGKLKKQKVLPEITEDVLPFEIPISWKWVKLGNVVNYFMGKTPARAEPEWWGRDIPWVSISDMSEYGFIKITKESVSIKAINEKFSRISRAGTLLMSFKLTVGRTSILDMDAVHNEAIISILPYVDLNNSLRDYLFYFLPTIVQWGDYKNAMKGKTLNSNSISNLYIPLPPTGEQKRIVDKITNMLPMIHRYEKLWLRLNELNKRFPEDLQKSILQDAIQGKLCKQKDEDGTAKSLIEKILLEKDRLIESGQIKKQKALPPIQEDEIPFDIPDSWRWIRLKELVYNRGQKKPDTEFSYIDIGSIDNTHQKLTNLKKYINTDDIPSRARRIVGLGDILYSTVRPYLHNMCIVDKVDSCETIASTGFAAMTCYKMVHNKFLFYYLLSPTFDKYANSAENSKGVAYPAINDQKFYKALVPLPPLNEQKRIAKKIEDFFALSNRYKSLLMEDNK